VRPVASTEEGTMSDVLPMAEIRSRYAGEWVLLDMLEKGEKGLVTAGRVLAHSKDRAEVSRRMLELRPHRFALYFLGTIAPGREILL
jgi:hypothetical protein